VNNINRCFRTNKRHPEFDGIISICMICTLILYEMSTVRWFFFLVASKELGSKYNKNVFIITLF